MIKNYFKIAWRNLIKNKISSAINIGGLAMGMAVVILISLWIYDELSFNKYHQHFNQIARVMKHGTMNGVVNTQNSMSIPIKSELAAKYSDIFEHIIISTKTGEHILATDDKNLNVKGRFMDIDAPKMLTLKMLKGNWSGLTDPSSILISETAAKIFFGDAEPINKIVKLDDKMVVKVTGVYENIALNSEFNDLMFISTWNIYASTNEWAQKGQTNWGINSWEIFVQIAENTLMRDASKKIKNIVSDNIDKEIAKVRKPELFLHPMDKWHLYADFKDGVNIGGRISSIWFFGIIGFFVLILACINFMNLTTARSEKRAKEVGIRKVVGSNTTQLISQFFLESLLVVSLSFILSLLIVYSVLPFFNEISGKKVSILWLNPVFGILGIGFTLITGMIASSYPALYLSSFKPIKVLKGTFHAGRFAAIPRKVLVIVQFSVSISLIIGTIIVFNQIQFAKNRPIGYGSEGLLSIPIISKETIKQFDAIKNELIQTGMVVNMSGSQGPTTEIWDSRSGFDWPGKDPNFQADFAMSAVTHDFGKTIGWKFIGGRDFSKEFPSDLSSNVVLNEAAVKFMGLKIPIGETIKFAGENVKIVGVIKDMVISSPYEPIKQMVYYVNYDNINFFNLKINPQVSASIALSKIEAIFKKFVPSAPFDYKFADEEYAKKFADEERVGKLASFFAILAIFISCLGILGLASFIAEQRTKEIGVRKVLGASVLNVWKLLSKDFVVLVFISFLIASPIAWYFMNGWLQNYEYRTTISWWVFVVTCSAALLITLLTVSFQAIKAALANPVKSLRTE